ncbi:BlaI/MecI/CopY family transcriptional regulator [Mariniblastus fucicola]|uniref:Penicillinase repressor n=1 Tax=Mariniblastus fucicola TaxID=980251 RepID=A0A5B9PDW4_9BACT|nr:BlaI/MecI/CopY family transcriptional regulator [Mariniblastus fucicola]QEG21133.1 Penicillinase repressor [Mariniblastus fucicola]
MAKRTRNDEGLPPLSDAQLEIMQIVWKQGETTVSEVWTELAGRRNIARNTVLTTMDRLAKRGWLTTKKVGNTHLYTAPVGEQQTMRNVVRKLVDTAFAGSAEKLVMALLDDRGVTEQEANRIRKMISENRKNSRGKNQ